MLFLVLNNVDIKFDAGRFTWRYYCIEKTSLKTRQIELIDKSEFIKVALDKNSETFVINIADLEALKLAMAIYPFWITLLAMLQ